MCRILVVGVVSLTLGGTAGAQSALVPVEDVELPELREHARSLLKAFGALKAPLPAESGRELRKLLDGDGTADAIQRVLDARCLAGVSINPESRVKAARGALAAGLVVGRPAYVLVRVHNEAGVTAPVAIEGPQVRTATEKGDERWLEVEVCGEPPLRKNLGGGKVEYVVVKLTARQAGKREATLRFDVGQGTQDLGFRAEVPILFAVRER